jgi:paraquat-inducible protein A
MRSLAVLVLFCGIVLPVALLASLAVLHWPWRLALRSLDRRLLFHAAHFVEHWAFPEVQVLAVFVAIMRLGRVVDIEIGPGFWCYCAMAFFLVLAQRSFDFEVLEPTSDAAGRAKPATP